MVRCAQLFIFGALLVAANTACAGDLSKLLQHPPDAWMTVDISLLNSRVDKAIAEGKSWPKSPLMLTLELLGANRNSRSSILEEMKNRVEDTDTTSVSVIRDDFLDDSVRGDWHEFELQRLPDNTWRVATARVAYRCRRSANLESFQGSLCP